MKIHFNFVLTKRSEKFLSSKKFYQFICLKSNLSDRDCLLLICICKFPYSFFNEISYLFCCYRNTNIMEVTNSRSVYEQKIQNEEISKGKTLNSSLFIIFLVLIIDLLGFTVILPLMPSIYEYYDSNEQVNFLRLISLIL